MKIFLVQYETFAKWQTEITPDQLKSVILIKEVKNLLEDDEEHCFEILQPKNPLVKLFFG